MTWAEYQIRLDGWKRKEEREWYKVREIAWSSLIGSHLDPKKLPKSKDSFMPIGKKKSNKITQAMIDKIKEAREIYNTQING